MCRDPWKSCFNSVLIKPSLVRPSQQVAIPSSAAPLQLLTGISESEAAGIAAIHTLSVRVDLDTESSSGQVWVTSQTSAIYEFLSKNLNFFCQVSCSNTKVL